MVRATHTTNPLARGFYTVSEAARLVEGGTAARIYGWLRGYPRTAAGPLLTRDYQPIHNRQELSFIDLIEISFVEHFRSQGVKALTLRRAADALREEFATQHPFATDRVHLLADKADIFLEIMRWSANEEKDRVLLSLTNKNYVMEEMIWRSLVPGLSFDRQTHQPQKWAPRPRNFPRIFIDPRIAYGQPVGPSAIPTSTLYEAWKAEGEDIDEAAFWFDVASADVAEAVNFEICLDRQEAFAA